MEEEEKVSKRQLILVGIAVLLTGILLIVKPTYSVFQVNKTINIMDAKVGNFGNKVLFVKSFGGSKNDQFIHAELATDGGYVAIGFSASSDGDLGLNKGITDAIIVKYDDDGNVVWNKSFGGSGYDNFAGITQTFDDGYVVVGRSNSSDGNLTGLFKGGVGTTYDAIIVKYDSNGNILWNKNYGGTWEDDFNSVASTLDGGYIAVGTSESTDGDLIGLNKGGGFPRDAIIVKYDGGGNVMWNKNFGGSNADYFYSVQVTSDGGYIAVGRSDSTDGDLAGSNLGGPGAIIVKYDSSGNVVWNKSFGGNNSTMFYNVVATSVGEYITVGTSNSTDGDLTGLNKGNYDAIIVKYDVSGNVIWNKNFGGSNPDYFRAVQGTSDGGYVAVGTSNSTDGDLTDLNKGSIDATIVKYSSSGNVIWNKNFGGSGNDNFYFVRTTPDGWYIIGGEFSSTNGDFAGLSKGGGNDAFIVKGKFN